jgi:hypothetical protein
MAIGCSFIAVLIFPIMIVGGFMSNTPLMVLFGFIGVIGSILSMTIASRIDKMRKLDYQKEKASVAHEIKQDLISGLIICPICGAKKESNAQFCGVCGAKFSG